MTKNPYQVDEKWHSLRNLLEKYPPALLASAIESHGIWVFDRYNRIVEASAESLDDYSKNAALDLVSNWAAELNAPGPTYSWDHERFELESHPTQKFGWPEQFLPSLSETAATSIDEGPSTSLKEQWVKLAKLKAAETLKRERDSGHDPKQDAVAREVAIALAASGIRTARGAINAENIKREALAGTFWQSTRLRPKNSK
jgi:hypothetical protein